jgi:hypothetical protein
MITVELDEDFLFALFDFSKFENASWEEPVPESVDNGCVSQQFYAENIFLLQRPFRQSRGYTGTPSRGAWNQHLFRTSRIATDSDRHLVHAYRARQRRQEVCFDCVRQSAGILI